MISNYLMHASTFIDKNYELQNQERGGGVLIAADEGVHVEHIQVVVADQTIDESHQIVHYSWLQLKHYQHNERTLYLGVFYFPPHTHSSV